MFKLLVAAERPTGCETISVLHNLNYTQTVLSLNADEYTDKPLSTEKVEAGRTSRANALLRLAIDYLEHNYHKDISLEETAETIQISSFYLSKLFKKAVGENFIDYLTAIRIGKAKEFLTNPLYTVKDVCYQVGYKDPNYFARVFKKTCGITPTQYQMRHLPTGFKRSNCFSYYSTISETKFQSSF